MRRISILVLILFACLIAAPVRLAAQPAHYTVTDLGTLGGTYSFAGGMSTSSNWVEGFSTLSADTALHAALWRRGRITDLGTVGGPNSVAAWRPNNFGDAGVQAETSTLDPLGEDFCGFGISPSPTCLPALWRNDIHKLIPLPTLGGNNGAADGVNDWDEVVGTAQNTTIEPTCVDVGIAPFQQYKPVIWRWGRVHELPTFSGDPVGGAHAINDLGQAVGWSGPCATPTHALLWQNGKAIDLGNFGGSESVGNDINIRGHVTGNSALPDGTPHAFLWRNGAMTDLGTLPGDVGSFGGCVNSKDQVVGGSFDALGNERPFLWQNGAMTDLNTLIPADSPLYLFEADCINDWGQIVGGALQISTGETHAFLATPSWHTGGSAASAARSETTQRPAIALPDNVRKLLQRRGMVGRFKGGLIRPQ